MAFQSAAEQYRTSSLSHPANSPFGRTAQNALSARTIVGSPAAAAAEEKQQSTSFSASSSVFNGSASFAPSLGGGVSATQSSPFSVRPELDPLEREKREIERRRQRLEDRKTRILHAKTRVMGVDVDALNEQVRERTERERLEQERELYHDALTAHHAQTLSGLEEERKVRERIAKEELNFYRNQQAQEKKQREARDASGWHNQLDAAGSQFLQFTGEDRDRKARVNAQANQQSDWLAQQLAAQADREARDRQDAADYAEQQARIMELQRRNEEDRAAQAAARLRATQEYNQQVAAQKSQSRMRHAANTQAANQAELSATLGSALLNEQVLPSALGAHRAVPYNFKGFSTSQRQAVLDAQAAQAAALADRRVAERLEEADYARQSEAVRREMLRVDRAREEAERARLLALRDERQHQHKQKTLRDQYHNHVVYTNPVKEEYFQQFGTSAR